MSIQAIAYAFTLDIRPSVAKFVFVALCNFIREDGTAWCPFEKLAAMTSQDIKTVRGAVRRLQALGHLEDTGHRVGLRKQTPVYRMLLPDAVVMRMPKTTVSGSLRAGLKTTVSGSLQKSKTTGYGSEDYRIRSAKTTGYGRAIKGGSVLDPLLTGGDKSPRTAKPQQIGEHLARLKAAACKRR